MTAAGGWRCGAAAGGGDDGAAGGGEGDLPRLDGLAVLPGGCPGQAADTLPVSPWTRPDLPAGVLHLQARVIAALGQELLHVFPINRRPVQPRADIRVGSVGSAQRRSATLKSNDASPPAACSASRSFLRTFPDRYLQMPVRSVDPQPDSTALDVRSRYRPGRFGLPETSEMGVPGPVSGK